MKILKVGLALALSTGCKPDARLEKPIAIETIEVPTDLRDRFLKCLAAKGGTGFRNNRDETVWEMGVVNTTDGNIRAATLQDVEEAVTNCEQSEVDREAAHAALEACFLDLPETWLCKPGELMGEAIEECYMTRPPYQFNFGGFSGGKGSNILSKKGADEWLEHCESQKDKIPKD